MTTVRTVVWSADSVRGSHMEYVNKTIRFSRAVVNNHKEERYKEK